MNGSRRKVSVVGALGVYPMCRVPVPARRLIAYLSLNGCRAFRMNVANALWPDEAEDVGRANLRRAIWLTPARWIVSSADELHLDAEVDYAQALETARMAIEGGELSLNDITLLSNEILPGWHDEWLRPVQDAFHLLRVQALEVACMTMVASGQHVLAIQAGAAALAAEPLRESAVEALINAHLAQHNRHQAVVCFQSFAKRLKDELDLEPEASLSHRVKELRTLRLVKA